MEAQHEIEMLKDVIKNNKEYIIKQENTIHYLLQTIEDWWEDANEGQPIPILVLEARRIAEYHPQVKD